MTNSSQCPPLGWPTICESLRSLCADTQDAARLIDIAPADRSLSADAPELHASLDQVHGAYVRLVEAYRGYRTVRNMSDAGRPLREAPPALQTLASRRPEVEDVGALLQRLSFDECLAAADVLEEMLAAFTSLATGRSLDGEGPNAG